MCSLSSSISLGVPSPLPRSLLGSPFSSPICSTKMMAIPPKVLVDLEVVPCVTMPKSPANGNVPKAHISGYRATYAFHSAKHGGTPCMVAKPLSSPLSGCTTRQMSHTFSSMCHLSHSLHPSLPLSISVGSGSMINASSLPPHPTTRPQKGWSTKGAMMMPIWVGSCRGISCFCV